MLFGIAFSAIVRGDMLGTMAGIGASYIIFDFLAFYGLKLYMLSHPEDAEEEKSEEEEEEEEQAEKQALDKPGAQMPKEDATALEEEPIEVMGGGDAVLSAVMSAYLGWQGLVLALVIGFVAGTVMGLGLLMLEMKKAGLLKECGRRAILYGSIGASVLGGLSFLMVREANNLAISTACMGGISGALLGMVLVGTRVSKPFPFGPALALGGFVAMFLIPYWLPFY
jgi:prepilin signal peptidase PulO-like enzyme (type II secretory pathway)